MLKIIIYINSITLIGNTYNKIETDNLLNLKQILIGINELNINQINTLQTTLDLKAPKLTTYTKTENDAQLLLKVNKTDLANNLSTLNAKIGGTPLVSATMNIKGDTVLNTLILESSKGTQLTYFHFGTNGDIYLRPSVPAGVVCICDNTLSKVLIGTSTASAGYKNYISGDTHF